ncbi:unnamed protein product [Hermetia illucens]|uniref:Uncharacterized protein n=1 Tax=Hermetia illucens TaxID=343691 RepID=A0A7R8UCB2_HERIL|nr:unnamed protein product [Hermetia illucens]
MVTILLLSIPPTTSIAMLPLTQQNGYILMETGQEYITTSKAIKRHLLHRNILTDVDISEYKMNAIKLQHIKSDVLVGKDNSTIFIEIPLELEPITVNQLIPLPNANNYQIYSNIERFYISNVVAICHDK